MSHQKQREKYIDLKINGRLFPSWILANFPQFKLPEIIQDENYDACAVSGPQKLREYQMFISKIIDYNSPYKNLLVYHGLGSGKTASTINLYNVLYNSSPAWNVFILLPATLRAGWIKEMETWLQKEDKEYRLGNIKFISYNAPNADKAFMDAVKNADTSKKNLYIIEEAHLFIGNVYSNISTGSGKRAQTIYDYIMQDKKESEGVRVILLTATPTINRPFELALLFNLLRSGTFPKSEAQFNQYYISLSSGGMETLNPLYKNNFQRRILGLVSYYIGATPDYFARKVVTYVDVPMSKYQDEIYDYFSQLEDSFQKKSKRSQTYMSYTRQSCNFVFPAMGQGLNGENRPRPRNFKLADRIDKGELDVEEDKDEKYYDVSDYLNQVEKFVNSYDSYLTTKLYSDKDKKYTIADDIKKIRENYNYNLTEFYNKEKQKSQLFEALYACSAKYLTIILNILRSPGPVLVYSNYVLMEGLQIFKMYLKYFGFSSFKDMNTGTNGFRYIEYHGGIDKEERFKNVEQFNVIENKKGDVVKIIMISPAGAEGLSLRNTRQVHIVEPYWHEVRIKQMVGRAIRLCSHKDLPKNERVVEVFRYKSIRSTLNKKMSTDQLIESIARSKEGLLQSFEDAIKESAIDCELYKAHNLLVDDYKCFKFEEKSLFDEQIGPAYKEDLIDDLRMNNGSNSTNSKIVRIKVIKIKAVKILSKDDSENIKYSQPKFYWYNPETYIVYDYDLKYPIGKVGISDDNIPLKLSEDTYIIDKVIPIPHIDSK
jgi:superfamily II DNA or RNA helicase